MNKNYEKEILTLLIGKYHKSELKKISGKITRTVSIKPGSLYSRYDEQSAEYHEINSINNAVQRLEKKGFVVGKKKRYSDDYSNILLVKESINDLLSYAHQTYDIILPDDELEKEKALIDLYRKKGKLTDFYISNDINRRIESHSGRYNPDDDAQFLKLLDFVQSNVEELYIREVSMKVFGSSKVLERQYLTRLCNLINAINHNAIVEEYESSEILKEYHINDTDREILIKGNLVIHFKNHLLNVADYLDGISLMSSDISRISKIEVRDKHFITIENKTSFLRFKEKEYSAMYLGGFAGRYQIQFLKKLYEDNREIEYFHFGDIDMGGFRIYQNLRNTTGILMHTYHMSIEDLRNPLYSACLSSLTDNDRIYAESLKESNEYGETIAYMLRNNVKLEQEIISYHLATQTENKSS